MSKIYKKYLSQVDGLDLRIKKWNQCRNGLVFDLQLEVNMMHEEFNELLNATNFVNFLKEAADCMFVGIGGEFKDDSGRLKAYSRAMADIIFIIVNERVHTNVVGDNSEYDRLLEVVLAIVTEANEAKGFDKDANGKIIKGPNYVCPEVTICAMLEEMRNGY